MSEQRSTGGMLRAADGDGLEHLARVGLVSYGVVHLLVAWLALQLAWGSSSESADQSGALSTVADSPVGKPLLWIIAVGLVALAVWQALEVLRWRSSWSSSGDARTKAVKARETSLKDIAAGQPKYPARVAQIGNCFSNQFEVPLLFYILIALALPLRHADLFIVLMSWVFVVTRFAHAGIFVTTNNIRQRGLAWFAGVLVLLAMWIYFALKILLLI